MRYFARQLHRVHRDTADTRQPRHGAALDGKQSTPPPASQQSVFFNRSRSGAAENVIRYTQEFAELARGQVDRTS